jgi:hypothetical protein
MDESGQLHTPAALPPGKEPPKPSNRNLGGPHIKVENFHLKFIPIGCSPHLKEYWKNILRLRNVIGLTEN